MTATPLPPAPGGSICFLARSLLLPSGTTVDPYRGGNVESTELEESPARGLGRDARLHAQPPGGSGVGGAQLVHAGVQARLWAAELRHRDPIRMHVLVPVQGRHFRRHHLRRIAMRVSWPRLLELSTVAVLVAGSAWLGQLVHHNYVIHGEPTEGALAPPDVPASSADGAVAPVNLAGRERPLLLLVMSTECGFCEANMPNWRQLAGGIGTAGDQAPDLLVLSVSPADATEAYLQRHGLDLPFRVISPASLPLLGIEGYPGTVAFHPDDPTLRVWAGVLEAPHQEAILSWSRMPWRAVARANAN